MDSQHHQHHRHHPPPAPSRGALPPEGSIQEGKVARIEAYGAFVDLEHYYRLRGLIHISQLANTKVDQVSDVVEVDDRVWVKVLSVTLSETPEGRTRPKIGLSLKDVSQDGECTDLGAQQERQQALKQQITQTLQSSIGMGVALDPMAAAPARKSGSHLILKHQPPTSQTVINGYALVPDEDDDDNDGEGMPPQQQPTVSAADASIKPAASLGPRGRGRGTTLPAWMTRQQSEGPTTMLPDNEENSTSSTSHGKEKKPKHKDKKKHRSSKHHKKHHKKSHRKSKRSRRSYSPSRSSSSSSSHRSLSASSPSPSQRRKSRRDRSEERTSRRDRSPEEPRRPRDNPKRSRSRSRSREEQRSSRRRRRRSRSPTEQFKSVEDAQRLIEHLEAKKRQREHTEK